MLQLKALHFDPIKKNKKKAQIRALYSTSTTRSWFVKGGEGRRNNIPFLGFTLGRR